MARFKGVSSAQAGLSVKVAYHFTRRSIGKLTGRETERMIEPLEMYAHVPVLFKGYAKLEQATAKLHEPAVFGVGQACSRLRRRYEPHTGRSLRRAIRQASATFRRRSAGGAVALHRAGEHARSLQPGARHRLGWFQRGHGMRGPRCASAPMIDSGIAPALRCSHVTQRSAGCEAHKRTLSTPSRPYR